MRVLSLCSAAIAVACSGLMLPVGDGGGCTSSAVVTDRDVLNVLYADTGGPVWWSNSSGWNTTAPTCSWYGVGCDAGGHVVSLFLGSNNLLGSISAQLATLSGLTHL